MNLVKKAEVMNEKTKRLCDNYFKMIGVRDIFSLDSDEYMLIKESLELINDAYDFSLEYSQAIEVINAKLDKLIKLEEGRKYAVEVKGK